MNSSYSSYCPGAKRLAWQKEFNRFCPPSSSDDLCLLLCLYPSSMAIAQNSVVSSLSYRLALRTQLLKHLSPEVSPLFSTYCCILLGSISKAYPVSCLKRQYQKNFCSKHYTWSVLAKIFVCKIQHACVQ